MVRRSRTLRPARRRAWTRTSLPPAPRNAVSAWDHTTHSFPRRPWAGQPHVREPLVDGGLGGVAGYGATAWSRPADSRLPIFDAGRRGYDRRPGSERQSCRHRQREDRRQLLQPGARPLPGRSWSGSPVEGRRSDLERRGLVHRTQMKPAGACSASAGRAAPRRTLGRRINGRLADAR